MYLKQISLLNFRNYRNQQLNPHFRINVILGPNAQGKTNLLEAIYFCGMGFSFRGRDKDIVAWGQSNTQLKAVFELKNNILDVLLNIDSEGKKTFNLIGAENKRKYLPGRFGIIIFRPDDLQLVKGSPVKRRDFIDFEIGCIEPVYRKLLQSYRRVVLQRNNLLKQGNYKQNVFSREDFQTWNDQFYRYGAELLLKRIYLLKMFFPLVRESYESIAGHNETLNMKYLSTATISGTTISGNMDIEQLVHRFREEGKTREKEELVKKQTVFGPHRDDITFFLNNRDIRHFGSQGQVRSLILALKTAQLKLFQQETGEKPILLLDDVFMELDESRRSYLIKIIRNHELQTFITSTEINENINNYIDRVYFINKGSIREDH